VPIWGRTVRLAGIVVALCSGGAAAAAPTPPPPPEAYGALPAASDVSISPDGNLLAWNDGTGPEPRVVIFDLTTRKYKRFLRIPPEAKFRSVTWADNETALITISGTRDQGVASANWSGHDIRLWEIFRTIAVDANSSIPDRMLLMGGGERPFVTGAHLVALHTLKPKTVLMSTLDYKLNERPAERWTDSLFEVDTRTGKGTLLQRGMQFTRHWLADASGQHIARAQFDEGRHLFSVEVLQGASWHEVYRSQDGHVLYLHGFSGDAAAIVATGVIGDGHAKLWSLPLDGSAPHVLLEDATRDVIGVELDPFTGRTIAGRLSGADPEVHWVDFGAQTVGKTLERAFKDKRVEYIGRSQSATRILAKVSTPSQPPVFYLVDLQTHNAEIVGEEYPALANVPLGEVRTVSYKARDGLDIPAYLTLPPGVDPHGLPMVVLPHDGPEARDYPTFDWWAQFLASRGYAVLKPQFRGSIGFGEAFRKAGYRQWGGLMQDDVSDGVAAMITQGIANPKRVCIVGAGYGGFAALAGAALTPTLYKCAVSINGVSNLPEMLAYLKARQGSQIPGYWREHIGDPDDPALAARSPEHAADRITASILLMHSTDDTLVPFRQSQGMANILKSEGKPTELIELRGEDHWLSQGETRTRMLHELEKFLAANL
jgi:dienelactone hydrolase